MRPPFYAVTIAVLVGLLTWLSSRAVNPEAERFDRALAALDHLVTAENAFNRDVLRARAGMLRNYDPLVRDVDAMDEWFARLRRATREPETEAALDRLQVTLERQETLVEQFKTDNALLQNSLAYFERFSARLSGPDQSGPLPPAVTALAAAMLRLSLDTSPEAAREVAARLDVLDGMSAEDGDAQRLRGLLAHGRMLQDLLPATSLIVKGLCAVPRKQEQATVRGLILTQQSASRGAARRFRLMLYLTSLLLVAILVHLGLQLRARVQTVRRRAAFEHVLAGVSMRFINARPQDIDRDIEQALGEMAQCAGADRAYFLISGATRRLHAWCRDGFALPAGWPDQATALAARFAPDGEGIIQILDVHAMPPGADRDACAAFGLRAWACARSIAADGAAIVLGFDAVSQPCRKERIGELSLLRMARDTLVNAVARQHMEQERARLEGRLQQARRMETVGALASGIAHNFNNIIGAILGYAEIAEAQISADSRSARSIDEIRRAGERARDLIEHILAFGRRRDVRRRSLDLRDVIAESASLLRASLPPGIALAIREMPQPARVAGEAAQLQQVIINLCRNAAQAMDNTGSVEIAADLQDVAHAHALSHGALARGRYIRLAVSDAGSGMSEPVRERIFEPFFTTRLTGNGLGLATVREIVREHGGAMNVWSAPGEGSRFEVWLPCLTAVEPAAQDEATTLPFGSGETLLLIDVDRERLLHDEEMLAALGYEPVGFADAGAALGSCRDRAGRYEAFVVGHLASTRAALDVAATLHEIAPDTPILLTTAHAEEIGAGLLIAAGISEVVGRPVVAAEIAAALQRCLDGSRRRRHAQGAA